MQLVAHDVQVKHYSGLQWNRVSKFTANLLLTGMIFLVATDAAVAQRRPIADDTLGDERSIVTPDPTNPLSDRIDGGATRGENLFHSFQDFGVDEGRSVYFSNPSGIRNILSRVTGSNASEILGVLGVLGDANLFLLNPNGIFFGPNAQLDIRGSFLASTAESFVFDNGFAFSATNPQSPPLLTVNVPIGLQYGANPGEIRSQGASLQVPNGQTLTLAGGVVNVQEGQLLAPGGRVDLGGISAGTIGLNIDSSLSFPDNVARADISITNAARVDVRAGGGGSITVNARNVEVGGGSQLLAGIREGLGTPDAQAGDITISATNLVQFDGEDRNGSDSGAFSTVESGAEGTSGSVSINTRFLEVLNGALLDASTFGQGNAGSVTINATDRVRFDGAGIDGLESGVRSEVVYDEAGISAVGTAGGVSITTKILEALDGAQISTSTNGIGNGGRVAINATDLARFDGEDEQGNPSGAFSNVNRGAVGNAGGVFITTDSLEVTNGAQISASTFGTGNAGGITINATDLVRFDGVDGEGNASSGAYSQVNSRGIGNAGGVLITTGSLEVTNGAQIAASTFGIGDSSGGITINATDWVRFDGESESGVTSGAFSSVQFSNIRNAPAEGNAGGISITTGSLELLNGALLDASTDGIGNAGNITITARDSVSFDGRGTYASGAYSSVEPRAIGRAGSINITTNSLSLTNGGIVSANTFNQGDAGNITLRASDSVSFDGIGSDGSASGVFSSVSSGAIGQGGNIDITTGSLSLSNGAQVNAATSGQGRAGNIIFSALMLTVAGNAQVLAETSSVGNGGNIVVNAPVSVDLRRTDNLSPVLSVETRGAGQAGDITITTPSLTLAEQARITATARDTATNPQGGGSITLNASNLDLAGTVGVFAETQSASPAGTLTLQPDNGRSTLDIDLSGGAEISASTSSSGRGGNLIVTAPDAVTIRGNGRLSVETTGTGTAGDITIRTPRLTIANGAVVSASTFSTGAGGDLSVDAPTAVLLRNQGQLLTESEGDARAGNLTVNTAQLTLQQGSEISASNRSSAGGDIQLQELNLLSLDNSSITASTQTGAGGSVRITTRDGGNVALNNNSRLAAEATGGGNAGSLTLNNVDRLTLQGGSSATVSSIGQGTAGALAVDAQTALLDDRSTITGTTEAGIGGNISLNIAESLRLNNNSQISASTQSGRGGDITIQGLDTLRVLNSLISAESTTGQAGRLTVNASDSILLRGTGTIAGESNRGGLSVRSNGGDAGRLTVTTNELNIRDGASIAVSNTEQGNAGRLTINAHDVSLNRGRITGATEAGEGGSIILQIADSLRLRNNSQISAATNDGQGGNINLRGLNSLRVFNSLISAESATGQAGELTVNASDVVLLDGRGDRFRGGLSVRSRGGESAGNLTVNTNELNIQNRAAIAVGNTRQGDAGDLTVNARDVSLNRGSITGTTVAGTGGDIQLNNLDSLRLSDRSAISASTRTGQGGSLSINTRENGDLALSSDSNLAAEANDRLGIAGSLEINNVDDLTVEDRSAITVSNRRGNAGNLRVNADSVTLDNGTLEAIAGAGRDGNIELNASGTLLQLSNASRISAQALNQASGGNVILNASNGFVVANPLENSDILANAEGLGDGGNINITTQSIFGLAERDADSPFSDINASSQVGLDGTIELNTLNIDPTQGLAALPENVAAPNQIDQRCATGGGGAAGLQGEFVVSGRGGLPPNADESLSSDAVQVDLVTVEEDEAASNQPVSLPERDNADGTIVEAQGWVVNEDGNILLTASTSLATLHSFQQHLINCPAQ